MSKMGLDKLWRCPKCGHRFTTRNVSHSCGRYAISGHFKGKTNGLLDTFKRYVAVARECGPVTVYAQKTRIVLQHRVRFAGIIVHPHHLEGTIWLFRRVRHRLLSRTEPLGKLGYNAHFRLKRPVDIDKRLSEYLKEAYLIHSRPSRLRPDEIRSD